MFKVFRDAAEARRAFEILHVRFYGGNWTLPTLAQNAVDETERLEALCSDYFRRLTRAQDDLRAANAKIDRMTSGLRRGSKKAA